MKKKYEKQIHFGNERNLKINVSNLELILLISRRMTNKKKQASRPAME